MPDPQRVEFITRHFKDLQTIRFAPLPVAILFVPFINPAPHGNVIVARTLFLIYLLGIVGFYWWSTGAIKRRYGSVKLSNDDAQRRMNFPPATFALYMIMVAVQSWFYFLDRRNYHWEVYGVGFILIRMMQPILDSTNPSSRRVAWTVGLVVLFGAGYFLNRAESPAICFLVGGVWLSLSIFDFLLLRRTFAEISSPPSTEDAGAVAQYG
jgi:hypothetical protein